MIMACLNFRLFITKEKQTTARRWNCCGESAFDRFLVISVEQGVSYDYYFEVFDNDAIHNFKSTKSSVFSNRVATDEMKIKFWNNNNDNINSLEKSLKKQDKQISEMEKLQNLEKRKNF
jgi:hypothetical protein